MVNILLVEDDEAIRENCHDVLENMNHQVSSCSSTQSAMSLLELSTYDLAILDISINGNRNAGLELCSHIKSTFANIDIIMYTSSTNLKEESIKIGASGYIIKSNISNFISDFKSLFS